MSGLRGGLLLLPMSTAGVRDGSTVSPLRCGDGRFLTLR